MSIYDKDGNRISLDEWLALARAGEDVPPLDHDDFGDIQVSTVLIGVDHGSGAGEQLIFEATVSGGPLDQEQMRWSTWPAVKTGQTST